MPYTVIGPGVREASGKSIKVRTSLSIGVYRCIDIGMICRQDLCNGILQLRCIPVQYDNTAVKVTGGALVMSCQQYTLKYLFSFVGRPPK